MNEPKTLDQYRDLCKVLKLKVMKQKMLIQDLEVKNSNITRECDTLKTKISSMTKNTQTTSPIQTKTLDTAAIDPKKRQQIIASNLKGKNQVMKVLKQACHKLGITPEAIFRIADTNSRHVVEYDHFRNILYKMDLNLSPKQISTLIYMFDENCNSIIQEQEFLQTLQGYQIADEDKESSKIYKHICQEKVASLINEDHTNAGTFFAQMNSKRDNSIDLNTYEECMKKSFSGRILQKQIMASFYGMDLEGNGFLDKQNFVYGINSTIKKVATIGASQKKSTIKQTPKIPPPQNQKSQMKTNGVSLLNMGHSQTVPPNNSESRVSMHPVFSNIDSILNVKNPVSEISTGDILEKLRQQYNITLIGFYEQLCQSPLNQRVTLFNFKKVINRIAKGKKVDLNLVGCLFKVIDRKLKGSIYFSQLIYYYLAQGTDASMILRLLGKFFSNNDLNCEKFWFLFGINPDSDISKHRFVEVMGKTFEGTEESAKMWEKFWNYFDKGRGVISVETLSREIAKYQIVEQS